MSKSTKLAIYESNQKLKIIKASDNSVWKVVSVLDEDSYRTVHITSNYENARIKLLFCRAIFILRYLGKYTPTREEQLHVFILERMQNDAKINFVMVIKKLRELIK